LVIDAGFPLPRFNVPVDGERYTHVVDAYWPEHKLVVQLDGFAHHRTRRDRERDAEIDADLELAGHRVVRLTWGDVTIRRARTVRRYEALLRTPSAMRPA
jgi:very-short-patch-repair endonuclease